VQNEQACIGLHECFTYVWERVYNNDTDVTGRANSQLMHGVRKFESAHKD